MNEKQIVKDALTREYIKEMGKKLNDELAKNRQLQSISLREITFDEEGEMKCTPIGPQGASFEDAKLIIKYLVKEWANTKAEMWLETQLTKRTN
jgi:hypothetical protein